MKVGKPIAILGTGSAFIMFVGSMIYQSAAGSNSPIFGYFIIGFLGVAVAGAIKWIVNGV